MAKKDFENIVEMTREFKAWSEKVDQEQSVQIVNSDSLVWQARIQMATLQQLAVISHTMAEFTGEIQTLVALCKKQDKSTTE